MARRSESGVKYARSYEISGGKKSPTGKETWTITPKGSRPYKIVTSASSSTAMDQAVVKYRQAFERLAKR